MGLSSQVAGGLLGEVCKEDCECQCVHRNSQNLVEQWDRGSPNMDEVAIDKYCTEKHGKRRVHPNAEQCVHRGTCRAHT